MPVLIKSIQGTLQKTNFLQAIWPTAKTSNGPLSSPNMMDKESNAHLGTVGFDFGTVALYYDSDPLIFLPNLKLYLA